MHLNRISSSKAVDDTLVNILYMIAGSLAIFAARSILKPLLPFVATTVIDTLADILVGVVVVGILVVRFKRLTRQKLILATLAGLVIFGFSLLLTNVFSERKTTYFVADVSQTTPQTRQELLNYLATLADVDVPNNVEIGFGVLGAGLNPNSPSACNDITSLVPPAPSDASLSQFYEVLERLSVSTIATNVSNLQGAALYALDVLKGRRGIQQIVLVTPGPIDQQCSLLDRSVLDSAAQKFSVSYELRVITIGEVTTIDMAQLEEFADIYRNVGSVVDLPAVLEEVIESRPYPYGPYGN